ncbi:MAG: hypothetical protein J6C26_09445 [Clostridia bacterium]|nr:hypothetical protein [Clostridia bacterium]
MVVKFSFETLVLYRLLCHKASVFQNGKLVGAVTHVPVNDPTSGYGIFIENMPDNAA